MKDTIGKLIEELLLWFKKNYKRPRLWIGIVITVFCFVLLFPYIDSNFFYFSRIEKRISILERVMELDNTKVNSNQVYRNEYESILQEIEQQRERSVNSIMNKAIVYINSIVIADKGQGNSWIKFFTGAIWFFLVTLCVPLMNTFKKKSDKILAFILLLIISTIVGCFFSIIPIIVTPMVNYVGAPILQIILVIIIASKNSRKEKGDLQMQKELR